MKNRLRQGLVLLPLALLAGCGGQAGNSGTGFVNSDVSSSGLTSGGGTSGGSTTGGSTGSGTGGTTGGGSAPGIPANAANISDIQKLSGWEHCTDCAQGALAVYSMTQGIASPSLSGSSTRFSLDSGTSPWGQALWWKYLTRADSATHYVYDLYFYLDNPGASQALEFSVSHSTGGNRYEFAVQCAMSSEGAWRTWNPTRHAWDGSSVKCSVPAGNTWNHLVWEFERNSSNQVVFKAVTLNGSRSEVNMVEAHQADSSNGLDVSFQLDAKDGPILYSAWLDNVQLTYW